ACNPWGKPDGLRTRKKNKLSSKYIVRSRHAKK
ncbi:MAG: 50S ribosomal protein L2, partial [Candidatus Hydrogenedentes bacterium]|nr:50S ribosomal protein L2 [Candidatus Hydrogenedentota bacterium]